MDHLFFFVYAGNNMIFIKVYNDISKYVLVVYI